MSDPTRIFSKTTRDGRELAFDLIEEERSVTLRVTLGGDVIADPAHLIAIEPGKPGAYRNAPEGMAFAFAMRGPGLPSFGCLTRAEGAPIAAAHEAAIGRARERHLASLDPELRAALGQFGSSTRAWEAEAMREYGILLRAGY